MDGLATVITALGGLLTAVATLVGALYAAGLVRRRRAAAETAPAPQDASVPVPTSTASQPARLRAAGATLGSAQLGAALGRAGLYDRNLNPAGPGLGADFVTFSVGDGAGTALVRQPATGLVWQREAQPACPLADAEAAVRALNAAGHGQRTDWRLPTAEEAASLCSAADADGIATAAPFGRGAPFIWTADRTPDGRGWVAYLNDGQLSPESAQFNAWVRAVCTDTPA